MAKLPEKPHPLEQLLEQNIIREKPRGYLGMSQLGHSCPRYLWYYINLPELEITYTPRQIRIFNRGNNEEEVIKKELADKNIPLHFTQTELKITRNGKSIFGHCDGAIFLDKKYLVEIKAVKNSTWNKIKKEGIKRAHPYYYTQGQVYFHELYNQVDALVFIIANKDTEERLYIPCEMDLFIATRAIDKGFEVLEAKEPPKRIGSPTWYECKWCDLYSYCHFEDKRL